MSVFDSEFFQLRANGVAKDLGVFLWVVGSNDKVLKYFDRKSCNSSVGCAHSSGYDKKILGFTTDYRLKQAAILWMT